MKSRAWWSEDRNQWIVVLTVTGIYLLVPALATRRLVIVPVFGGCLALLFAFGLYRCREWARWVGYVFLVGALLLLIGRMRNVGVNTLDILSIGGLVWGFVTLRTMAITNVQWLEKLTESPEFEAEIDRRMAALEAAAPLLDQARITLLFTKDPELNLEKIARAAEVAFGHSFKRRAESMSDPTDAGVLAVMEKEPVVAGIDKPFLVIEPPYALTVYPIPDVDPTIAEYADTPAKNRAIADASFSLLVELAPTGTRTPPPVRGIEWTLKLARALADENCCGAFHDWSDRLVTRDSIADLASPAIASA